MHPYYRILELNCTKVKKVLKERLQVEGVFQFFLSFTGPERQLYKNQKKLVKFMSAKIDLSLNESNV